MKLLKIGHDSKCNIILSAPTVSALHAEMLLLDDGNIILTDMGSTNGTFVKGVKIAPGVDETIHRGDRVVFATTKLDWDTIPDITKEYAKYKQVINIGKSYRNDIRLTNNICSRYHATLRITKDNKALLVDSGSKNGTKVNGIAIQPNKEKQIKPGDNVMCADEDITEEIKPYIPNTKAKIIKILSAVACIAVLVVGGILAYPYIFPDGNYDKELVTAMEKDGPAVLRPATVYVRACYHYEVTIEDCSIADEIWDSFKFNDPELVRPYQATAFFVDREGRMVTNRHVAIPWDKDYRNEEEKDFTNKLQQTVKNTLYKILYFTKGYATYLDTRGEGGFPKEAMAQAGYGAYIQYVDMMWNDAMKKSGNNRSLAIKTLSQNVEIIADKLQSSKLNIVGKMDYITVGYAGRNYTHTDEFERCDVLGESGTADQDVAILQLNTKRTPDEIKYIYDINYFNTKQLVPLEDKLFVIGYPLGLYWGLDDKSKSLEPSIRETKCSKEPSRYTFDFQESSQGGASGSPVFDEKGRVVGVLCTGAVVGPTQAVQAKYIKELYDKVK